MNSFSAKEDRGHTWWSRIPLASQLASRDGGGAGSDVTAGLTVGVLLIPQGMAYALIAGLPPVYGLYAALLPLLVYALLGSSRQLAVGPVAMVSLLVAAGVAPLAEGNPERYLALAVSLAAFVGLIQLGMGLLKLGFVVNLLSHPVLSGFTSAAALIIATSQLPNLLGVDVPRGERPYDALLEAVRSSPNMSGITVAVGLAAILLSITIKRRFPRLPVPMVVVVVGTGAAALFGLSDQGLQIVGTVPSGLPSFALPVASLEDIRSLAPIALAISMVGFMESIAVAKTYASRNNYEIDPDQELKALGTANLLGSAFQSFPVTGGFSRTAVNDQAGAKTQLASVVSAVVIGVTLFALTGWFYYLPKAVLAAIIVVAVASLVDLKGARELWKVDRRDFALMLVTFVATLALGIEEGILVGATVSLIIVIHQISRPHTAALGRVDGTNTFRSLDRNEGATPVDSVLIFRMDASLFYGNAEFLRDEIRSALKERGETKTLVLDAYPINRVDSTGLHMLQRLVTELEQEGVRFFLACAKGPLLDKLRRGGL
ncbi:MAG: SulP family inorganic anion transporter, partial [Longimicrobiales bacterium]